MCAASPEDGLKLSQREAKGKLGLCLGRRHCQIPTMGYRDLGSNIEAKAQPLLARTNIFPRERLEQTLKRGWGDRFTLIADGEFKAFFIFEGSDQYRAIRGAMGYGVGEQIGEKLCHAFRIANDGARKSERCLDFAVRPSNSQFLDRMFENRRKVCLALFQVRDRRLTGRVRNPSRRQSTRPCAPRSSGPFQQWLWRAH